jgi:hypothetical protein
VDGDTLGFGGFDGVLVVWASKWVLGGECFAAITNEVRMSLLDKKYLCYKMDLFP